MCDQERRAERAYGFRELYKYNRGHNHHSIKLFLSGQLCAVEIQPGHTQHRWGISVSILQSSTLDMWHMIPL